MPSNLPSVDFVINPYTGCAFGCAYCYASFMGRAVAEANTAWASTCTWKTNAVELATDVARPRTSARKRAARAADELRDRRRPGRGRE